MQKIWVIGGATASGKSALATVLAEKIIKGKGDAVIINADSQQLYRDIPILSAQPQDARGHKLYGVLSASEQCSAGKWLAMAQVEIDKARSAGKRPILVGGTGLYLKSLMAGLSPMPEVSAEIREKARARLNALGKAAFTQELITRDPEIKARDTQRMLRAWEVCEATGIPLSQWQKKPPQRLYKEEEFRGIFLNPPRKELYARCDRRFLEMMEKGAAEEVRRLMARGDTPAMKALGAREIAAYLRGEMTKEEAITQAQQHTRHYAKRQITWFSHQLPTLKAISLFAGGYDFFMRGESGSC